MGVHYTFYITDDHLGSLDGRSCEQEAFYIKQKLNESKFVVFQDPVYVPQGDCICFELRNCVVADVYDLLKYDGVYYRKECDFRILNLKGK